MNEPPQLSELTDPHELLTAAINWLFSVRGAFPDDNWRDGVRDPYKRNLVWNEMQAAQLAVDRVFALMLTELDRPGWVQPGPVYSLATEDARGGVQV